ncbi:MAG TPA: hypothetical protein VLT33_22760 [Labilithrix sp.]|nr:hypothetical protein [Labilithrix sp.]
MSARLLGLATALVAASALAGCGHTETHAALLRAPQPPTGGRVELYVADQAPPTRPFYEIAMVQAIGFGADANPEDVTRALGSKAAALGCDAVVRVYIDVGYTRAHAAGVCVKYLGPAREGEVAPQAVLPAAPPANPPPPPMRPAPAPRLEPLPSSPNQGR